MGGETRTCKREKEHGSLNSAKSFTGSKGAPGVGRMFQDARGPKMRDVCVVTVVGQHRHGGVGSTLGVQGEGREGS